MRVACLGLLCALSVTLGAACDLVVDEGRTVVLGNRGMVLAASSPNAVRVLGGTLVVEDADLIGLGRVVEQGDPFPPAPGSAIVAEGGVVRIQNGTVSGGNVVVLAQNPATPAPPPDRNFGFPPLAPALVADGTTVEISGGLLVSSEQIGLPELFSVSPAALLNQGRLRMSGGEIRLAPVRGTTSSFGNALIVNDSQVEISGGRFTGGWVQLSSSRSRISGGSFPLGLMLGFFSNIIFDPPPTGPILPPDFGPEGCTELRGGSIPAIHVSTDETLFIHGSGFNLPLGPLAPELRLVNQSFAFQVTGTLADGSPLDLDLVVGFGGQAILAPPGGAGCDL